MIGEPFNIERDYPEGEAVERIWPPTESDAQHEAIVEWLRAAGIDPSRVNRARFAIERLPDGTHRIVFEELLDATARLHTCPEPGCADTHLAKTEMQWRAMPAPPDGL